MILQGVGHPISCLGVCYANDPKKGGYMTPAPALDLTTSLRGDFQPPQAYYKPWLNYEGCESYLTPAHVETDGFKRPKQIWNAYKGIPLNPKGTQADTPQVDNWSAQAAKVSRQSTTLVVAVIHVDHLAYGSQIAAIW